MALMINLVLITYLTLKKGSDTWLRSWLSLISFLYSGQKGLTKNLAMKYSLFKLMYFLERHENIDFLNNNGRFWEKKENNFNIWIEGWGLETATTWLTFYWTEWPENSVIVCSPHADGKMGWFFTHKTFEYLRKQYSRQKNISPWPAIKQKCKAAKIVPKNSTGNMFCWHSYIH